MLVLRALPGGHRLEVYGMSLSGHVSSYVRSEILPPQ